MSAGVEGLFPIASYSQRSAVSGSIRVARRAGNQQAAKPTDKTTAATVQIATGSCGATPKSWFEIMLPINQRAGPAPAINPSRTGVIPCRRIIPVTCGACAPSAIRIPISEVRRATVNEITPYIPSDTSSNAETAERNGKLHLESLDRDRLLHHLFHRACWRDRHFRVGRRYYSPNRPDCTAAGSALVRIANTIPIGCMRQ